MNFGQGLIRETKSEKSFYVGVRSHGNSKRRKDASSQAGSKAIPTGF